MLQYIYSLYISFFLKVTAYQFGIMCKCMNRCTTRKDTGKAIKYQKQCTTPSALSKAHCIRHIRMIKRKVIISRAGVVTSNWHSQILQLGMKNSTSLLGNGQGFFVLFFNIKF